MKNQLFINKFSQGSKENANITGAPSYMVPDTGIGTLVGIDTYSRKGLAILAKKSTIVTTGFTAEPHFYDTSQSGATWWVQCGDGSVLYSQDGGATFTDTGFPAGVGHGNGLKYFQNYMHAWGDTSIYVHNADPTVGSWTSITGSFFKTGLQNFATNPITGIHFPFLFPNNRGLYFGNGTFSSAGDCTLGFIGQVGTTLYNPAGTPGTDYLYQGAILTLPSYTYNIASIDFLPPSNLAISVVNYQNPSQGADLITWDTISNNKFTPPIRIYSNSFANNIVTAGIKQLVNRNQVLYSITGGNHAIYETNGSSFNLVEDISLYSNLRFNTGAEIDYPVYFNSYPQAICVVGNKLLTGIATITNTPTYPPNSTLGNNMGIFPVGVWSIAFAKDGSHSTQCEFTLPLAQGIISPDTTSQYAKITLVQPCTQFGSGTGQIIIGFGQSSISQSPNASYGVGIVDLYKYIDNINLTAIESELFEIGTATKPQTINLIEINLAKNLLIGHFIDISARTSQDQAWTLVDTYVGDGTRNYYHTDSNSIGATQFVQLRLRMSSGSPNATFSPQLKTVTIS